MIQQTVFPLENLRPSKSNTLVILILIVAVILAGIILYKVIGKSNRNPLSDLDES